MASVGTMRRVPCVQRREGGEENQSTLLCFEQFLHKAKEKGGKMLALFTLVSCLRWYPTPGADAPLNFMTFDA